MGQQRVNGGRTGRFGRLPRGTVRLRLTLLYTGLFLVCGTVLLAMTYVLVSRATADIFTFHSSDGWVTTGTVQQQPAPGATPGSGPKNDQRGDRGSGPAPTAIPDEAAQITRANQQRAEQQHQLLVQSGLALIVMTVLSAGLGWIVAGRALRPLRTITRAAQDISASNLNERLALEGPNDELKYLGDTIDGLLARLESSFSAQQQFIANASHELRTPLARQRTIAQVALCDPDATVESLRRAHDRVLAAGAQQEQLIAVLLTLARGQVGLNRHQPFDLAELSAEALTGRDAEAGNLAITITSALEPAPTSGDPQLAERLVQNLVDNALKYNVPQGRIEIATSTKGEHSLLRISNTGPIVPPDAVKLLFEPFRRLGGGRSAPNPHGLGLGLSIVEAVATAHGGRVEATARPEGGLVMTVRFPRRDAQSRVQPAERDAGAGRAQLTSVAPRQG